MDPKRRLALEVCRVTAIFTLLTVPILSRELPEPGYGLCPLGFVENLGQWPADIRYASESASGLVGLEPTALRFCRRIRDEGGARIVDARMRFEGARSHPGPVGESMQERMASFYRGDDPSRWVSGAAVYERVIYDELYDGVDLVVRESEASPLELEYDIVLAPGADLETVVFSCEGVDELSMEPDGTLALHAGETVLRHSPPRTWEERCDGELRLVECRYRLVGATRFGFVVDGRDPDVRLVIDPVVSWLTPLGNFGPENPWLDGAWETALNDEGELVVVGQKAAIDFPEVLPGDGEDCVVSDLAGSGDAFVARLDPRTGQILSTAVLGGAWEDSAIGLELGPDGVIDVCGFTGSPEFPVTNGTMKGEPAGAEPSGGLDGFVARLDPIGCELLFSTFLGGTGEDLIAGLSHLKGGDIVVAGYTAARDFPVTGSGLYTTHLGGSYDAFVSRIAPDSADELEGQLVYSSYFGGSGNEAYADNQNNHLVDRKWSGGLDVGSAGEVFFGGQTWSTNLPVTANAVQMSHADPGTSDAYVSVLRFDEANPGLATLSYCTYLGGTGGRVESLDTLTAGLDGTLWAAGYTFSPDFPTTPGALDRVHNGETDGWFAHLDPRADGRAGLLYSSFLGGSGFDFPADVSVAPGGRLLVVGQTGSTSFGIEETPGALASTNQGQDDGFVALIDIDEERQLSSIPYFTFVGSDLNSLVGSAVADERSQVYLGLQVVDTPITGVPDTGPPMLNGTAVLALDLRLPTAALSVEPAGSIAPFTANFSAADSTSPPGSTVESYAWELGDAVARTGPQASREFTVDHIGRHRVAVTVTNDVGLASSAEASVSVFLGTEVPEPWASADLGEPTFPGGARAWDAGAVGDFRIAGGGGRLGGTAEQAQFLHRELDGDFRLTARLEGLTVGSSSRRFGLMVRSGLEPGDTSYSTILVNPNLRSYWRAEPKGDAEVDLGPSVTPPGDGTLVVWLRIDRRAGVLSTWVRGEDDSWVELETVFRDLSTPRIDGPVLAGVLVNRGGSSAPPPPTAIPAAIVRASNVTVEPLGALALFRRGDSNADGMVDISDPVFSLEVQFLGLGDPGCLAALDTNADAMLDISDPVYNLEHQFLGRPDPPPPYPGCGPESLPVDDDPLSCDTPPGSCR